MKNYKYFPLNLPFSFIFILALVTSAVHVHARARRVKRSIGDFQCFECQNHDGALHRNAECLTKATDETTFCNLANGAGCVSYSATYLPSGNQMMAGQDCLYLKFLHHCLRDLAGVDFPISTALGMNETVEGCYQIQLPLATMEVLFNDMECWYYRQSDLPLTEIAKESNDNEMQLIFCLCNSGNKPCNTFEKHNVQTQTLVAMTADDLTAKGNELEELRKNSTDQSNSGAAQSATGAFLLSFKKYGIVYNIAVFAVIFKSLDIFSTVGKYFEPKLSS